VVGSQVDETLAEPLLGGAMLQRHNPANCKTFQEMSPQQRLRLEEKGHCQQPGQHFSVTSLCGSEI
jgi:hypothetical protein